MKQEQQQLSLLTSDRPAKKRPRQKVAKTTAPQIGPKMRVVIAFVQANPGATTSNVVRHLIGETAAQDAKNTRIFKSGYGILARAIRDRLCL